MAICTRRRWPSDTLFMCQSGSMSSTLISRSRLAGSTPWTWPSISPALKPPYMLQWCNSPAPGVVDLSHFRSYHILSVIKKHG